MAEENSTPQAPAQNKKPKPEKIKLILTGASSCCIDEFVLKSGDAIELENSRAMRFLSTGFFTRS